MCAAAAVDFVVASAKENNRKQRSRVNPHAKRMQTMSRQNLSTILKKTVNTALGIRKTHQKLKKVMKSQKSLLDATFLCPNHRPSKVWLVEKEKQICKVSTAETVNAVTKNRNRRTNKDFKNRGSRWKYRRVIIRSISGQQHHHPIKSQLTNKIKSLMIILQ